MPEIVGSIIKLLVGVALFIAGMSIMSGGLKKVAGKSLKRLFNKIGNNRFASLGIGTTVTALIQSSGATSVMAVGFINAGVMTIFQGICITLGAYIGTTVTGLLVSLSSVQSISMFLPLTALIGVIMSFFKKEKVKNFGEILIGLGILFVGLDMMKSAFTSGGNSTELAKFFEFLFAHANVPILLLLVGALFTMLTQSSSATTGIVIVMVGQGAIGLAEGFYLVLGATIGTVIVTIMATIGGSEDAKRTGLVCLIIRVFTAFIALAIIWPIEACTGGVISNGLKNMFGTNELTIAMFLVFYNIIFIGIILPFVEQFIKLGNLIIKDKSDEKKKKYLHFIDDRLLITPTIALGQAKNEITYMLDLARTNLNIGFDMIINKNFAKEEELKEREEQIDYINNAITDYLIKLSHDATMKEEKKVGSYFHIINDVERIGDHGYNFYDMAKKIQEDDLSFSEAAIKELNKMYEVVDKMFDEAKEIFFQHRLDKLGELHNLEDITDKLKNELSDAHYARIAANKCHMELSPFYTSLVSELERVADHLVNVGYAYLNPTGDDENILATVGAR